MPTAPTIHLNGSSLDTLSEGYLNVIRSLKETIDLAYETSPHGRDYYPQGDAALTAALLEHDCRLAKLKAVLDEYKALYIAVQRQRRENP